MKLTIYVFIGVVVGAIVAKIVIHFLTFGLF
jgi:hypothetical protein